MPIVDEHIVNEHDIGISRPNSVRVLSSFLHSLCFNLPSVTTDRLAWRTWRGIGFTKWEVQWRNVGDHRVGHQHTATERPAGASG